MRRGISRKNTKTAFYDILSMLHGGMAESSKILTLKKMGDIYG